MTGRVLTKIGNRLTWINHNFVLKNCKLSDFLVTETNKPTSVEMINNRLGTNLGLLEYLDIRSWLSIILVKFKNNMGEKAENFTDFFFKPIKGSNKIRSLLQYKPTDINKHNFTIYFLNIIGNPELHKIVKTIFPLWKLSFISFDLSNFIFKYINNMINTMDRLSKFKDLNSNCPLCISTNTVPISRDSTRHAFSDCFTINRLWNEYFVHINYNLLDKNILELKLVGNLENNSFMNTILNIDFFLVRYFIFQIRNLNVNKVYFGTLKTFLYENRRTFYHSNTNYKLAINNLQTTSEIRINVE